MKKTAYLLIALILLALCASAALAEEKATKDLFAMDTHISITAYGQTAPEALEAAEALLLERERLWSVTLEGSDIHAVNHADGEAVAVSAATADVLSLALEMAESTGGSYDPTIYPLVSLWGFTTGEYRVPEVDEIERMLEMVDYGAVSIDGCTVALKQGMQLDLGGIAKGRAGEEVAALLQERGVDSALVDLGGNIHAVGCKPDGSAWKIGVKSPTDEGLLGVLSICDQCVITSGAYERYFTGEDGETYGHIIDPDTGRPAGSGLLSVTIVGSDGGRCDALSTAMFVMGIEEACEYWRANEGFEMIALTDGGTLYVTAGLEENFVAEDEGLIREVCVVER